MSLVMPLNCEDHGSYDFGKLNLESLGECKIFVKEPDDTPSFYISSESGACCIDLENARYIDTKYFKNSILTKKDIHTLCNYITSYDPLIPSNSIWKSMYKIWKSGNENMTISEIQVPDMPEYHLLGGSHE